MAEKQAKKQRAKKEQGRINRAKQIQEQIYRAQKDLEQQVRARKDLDTKTTPIKIAEQLDQDTKAAQKKIEAETVVLDGGDDLISDGTYESYNNTVYLTGACNVGKSTLASVFIGHDIPKEWHSTNGLVIHFGQNGIDLIAKKMVPLDEDINIFSKVLRGKPKVKQSGANTNNDGERTEHQHDTKRKSTTATIPSATKRVGKSFSKQQCYKLSQEFLDGVRNGRYKIHIAPSDLVDFGGQRSFDMTHQLFIRQNGAFVVMFDGRYGFSDYLPEYKGMKMTNEDIVKHWVNSILTYCTGGEGILPMILFAATHSDHYTADDLEFKNREFLVRLREFFGNHEMKDHIALDTIYFINATNPFDSEIRRLQQRLVEIAFAQPSWGKRKPVRWVPLEIQLAEMKKYESSIVEKDRLRTINDSNGDLSLTEEQFDEFLQFQHSAGKIMYINQPDLDQFVVLYPPAFVNILRSFITEKMFWPNTSILDIIKSYIIPPTENKEAIRNSLEVMTKTGKISKMELQKIWSQKSVPITTTDEGEFVIKLLVHLDVLIVPRQYRDDGASNTCNVFLVPCIIMETLPLSLEEDISFRERSISLVFTLAKTVPAALAYKLIGAVASIWPLKKEGDKTLLFQFAAVLNVDSENDMTVRVQENEVRVYLTNITSKSQISPDVAASIQECLTSTLNHALHFYGSSMGGRKKAFSKSENYEIKIGEVCNNLPCVVTIEEAYKRSEWRCGHGYDHKSSLALKWMFERNRTRCDPVCRGPDEMTMRQRCDNVLLIRLANQLDVLSYKDLMLNLGLMLKDLNILEYQYSNPRLLMFMALKMWRDMVTKPGNEPCLGDIQTALFAIGDNVHHLCQIFRSSSQLEDIARIELQSVPEDAVLDELAHNMGNCTVHLGIELGLNMPTIEETLNRYPKDMFDQTHDILKKWKNNSTVAPTVFRLMKAVETVDKGGLTFLLETFLPEANRN